MEIVKKMNHYLNEAGPGGRFAVERKKIAGMLIRLYDLLDDLNSDENFEDVAGEIPTNMTSTFKDHLSGIYHNLYIIKSKK
jgi:hypothetical protein